jgi:beta-lactamase regulating signal transducer with metallopeptidase domain
MVTAQFVTQVLLASSVHALVIVFLAAFALRVARNRPARVRYRIGYLALLMVTGALIVTTARTARVWRRHDVAYASLLCPTAPVPTSAEHTPCSPALPAIGTAPHGPGMAASIHAMPAVEDPVIASPPGWMQALGAVWLRVPVVWEAALGWLWFVTVLVLGSTLIAEWLRWRRILREAASPDPSLVQVLGRLAADMDIRDTVTVRVSPEVQGPLVIGSVEPYLVIGRATLANLDAESLELLLQHELAHVRGRDVLASIVTIVPEVLLFFHPAVRWLLALVRHERECACDEEVTAASRRGRYRYACALYRLARLQDAGVPRPAVTATGGRLLDRVRRIVSNPPPAEWHPLARMGFRAAVGACFLLAFAQAGVAASFAGDILMRRDIARRRTAVSSLPCSIEQGPHVIDLTR